MTILSPASSYHQTRSESQARSDMHNRLTMRNKARRWLNRTHHHEKKTRGENYPVTVNDKTEMIATANFPDSDDDEDTTYKSFGMESRENSTHTFLMTHSRITEDPVREIMGPEKVYLENNNNTRLILSALKDDATFASQTSSPLLPKHLLKTLTQHQQLSPPSTPPTLKPPSKGYQCDIQDIQTRRTSKSNKSGSSDMSYQDSISSNINDSDESSLVARIGINKTKNKSNSSIRSIASSEIMSFSAINNNNIMELNDDHRIMDCGPVMAVGGIQFVSHGDSTAIPALHITPSSNNNNATDRTSHAAGVVPPKAILVTPQRKQLHHHQQQQHSSIKLPLMKYRNPKTIIPVTINNSDNTSQNKTTDKNGSTSSILPLTIHNIFKSGNGLSHDDDESARPINDIIERTSSYDNSDVIDTSMSETRVISSNRETEKLLRLCNSSIGRNWANATTNYTNNASLGYNHVCRSHSDIPNLMDDCTATTSDTYQTDLFAARREKEVMRQQRKQTRKEQEEQSYNNNCCRDSIDKQERLGAAPRPIALMSVYDDLYLEEEEHTTTTATSDAFDDLNTTTTMATSDAFDGLTAESNSYRNLRYGINHSKATLFSLERVKEIDEEVNQKYIFTKSIATTPLPPHRSSQHHLYCRVEEASKSKIKDYVAKSSVGGTNGIGNIQQNQPNFKEVVYNDRPTLKQLGQHQLEKHREQQDHQDQCYMNITSTTHSTNKLSLQYLQQKEEDELMKSTAKGNSSHVSKMNSIDCRHDSKIISSLHMHQNQQYTHRPQNCYLPNYTNSHQQNDIYRQKKCHNTSCRHDVVAQVILSQTSSTDEESIDDGEYSDSSSSSCCANSTSSSSYTANALSQYYIQPEASRKLVETYRRFSQTEERRRRRSPSNHHKDAKKAFALFEMRSRIMETDIERGLERRGGTTTVDDIVTTQYHLKGLRIRDAIIVSKAWRDGAAPKDVITAALLMQGCGATRSCCKGWHGEHNTRIHQRCLDDTDILQLKCPSLGPRSMRGFDMFTIGDCQSLLLKLTNEQVVQLTLELDRVKHQQMMAETVIVMDRGGDVGINSTDIIPQQAKVMYLSAVEAEKKISRKLKLAERGFKSVRNRIEFMIAKYEKLLVLTMKCDIDSEQSECDSFNSMTSEGSTQSDNLDEQHTICEDENYKINHHHARPLVNEKNKLDSIILTTRADVAENNAKCSAREVMQAKEETARINDERKRDLKALNERIVELEAKSSMERQEVARIVEQYELKLEEKRLTASISHNNMSGTRSNTNSCGSQNVSGFDAKSLLLASTRTSKDNRKIQNLKNRFRLRHAKKREERQSRNTNIRYDDQDGADNSYSNQ